MNSPTQSTTHRARSSVQARFASNWIEVCAIPAASAIMEALPIALALQILLPFVFGDQLVPTVASITLVLLGLHWWMMWSHTQSATADTPRVREIILDMLAFLLAFALLMAMNPDLLNDIPSWFVLFLLTGAAWGRSYYRTRDDEDADQLILALKIGFVVMLVVLAFAFTKQLVGSSDLNNTLITDFPIFFLSGLLALSFKRISILKKEQMQQIRASRSLKTGSWIVAMTITWVAVIIGSIAFEAFPPTVLASVVNFFLGVLAWVLGLLAYLFSLIPLPHLNSGSSTSPMSSQKPHMQPPPLVQHRLDPNTLAWLIHLVELGLGIFLVILLVIVLIWLKKRGTKINANNEDEVREELDRHTIRKERRAGRKPSFKLEPLDPSSARARYREFLTAMATQDLPRHANETPAEYQARLLALVQSLPEPEEQQTPPDQTILAELTLAYSRERYGAKPLARERLNYLRQWVPSLLRHLTKIVSKS